MKILYGSKYLIILLILATSLGTLSYEGSSNKRIIKGKTQPLWKIDNIGSTVLNIMDENQNLSAIINADTGEQISYKDMKENVISWAIWMRKNNITYGDAIALVSDSTMHDYIPMISALLEGVIFSSWPVDVTLDTARHFLNIIQPRAIFCVERIASVLKEACKLEKQWPEFIFIDTLNGREVMKHTIDLIPSTEVQNYEPHKIENLEKSIGLILFTSGSTGLPKGVAHSYLSILNNYLLEIPITYPNQKGRPTLLWYSVPSWATWPMSFYSSVLEAGVRIFHKRFNPAQTISTIYKYRVNYLLCNPSEMAALIYSSHHKRNPMLDSLEDVSTGGSILNPKIFDEFKEKVLHPNTIVRGIFGLTEIGGGAMVLNSVRRENTTAQPIGYPVKNTEIKIVDENTGVLRSPYEPGEIYVRKPCMFTGYYKDIEKTHEAVDDQGWLHTGDRGYYDEKGELYFIDRIKFMMKFQNHQVTPSEIEAVLLLHPDVLEAAVVPIPDAIDGEHPMAFVVKRKGSRVTEDELIKLSFTLGKFKALWGGVKFLDVLPRTPNQKVAKIKLQEIAKSYERKYPKN